MFLPQLEYCRRPSLRRRRHSPGAPRQRRAEGRRSALAPSLAMRTDSRNACRATACTTSAAPVASGNSRARRAASRLAAKRQDVCLGSACRHHAPGRSVRAHSRGFRPGASLTCATGFESRDGGQNERIGQRGARGAGFHARGVGFGRRSRSLAAMATRHRVPGSIISR